MQKHELCISVQALCIHIRCLLHPFLYIDMIIYYIKGLNACRNQAKITNVKCVCFCTYVPLRVSSRAVNINVLVQSLAGFIPKVFAF